MKSQIPHARLIVRLLFCFCALIALLWVVELYGVELATMTPVKIGAYVRGFGPLAAVIYVALYCVNVISVVPPVGLITVAAGMVFGFWGGAGLLFVGTMIGTTATFYISRTVGRKYVERMIAGKAQEFDEKLARRGFLTVLFFRVVPSLPFEVTNYLCGLTKISFKDYFWATCIGAIVWSLISAYFGAAVGTIDSVHDLVSKKFIVPACIFAAVMVFSAWYALKRAKK